MSRPIHCILLIDDDPDDNFYHRMVIEDAGVCQVIKTSENAVDALNYLTEIEKSGYVRPDVILLDINMPGMNGFEFLERYRHLPAKKQALITLIMLTTSPNPIDEAKAKSMGLVSSYHNKPLTRKLLDKLVSTHFQ